MAEEVRRVFGLLLFHIHTLIKRCIEIRIFLIGRKIKTPQDVHAQNLDSSGIFCLHGGLLPFSEIVMPVCDKLFVLTEVFGVQPLFYLYLCFVLLRTFVYLQEIPEGTVFIISSQGKEAAESGACPVDGASSGLI